MDPLARLLEIEGDLTPILVLGALAVARIAPILWMVPFLGGKTLPAAARIALAVLLTALLFPMLANHVADVPTAPVALVALLFKEVLFGAAMGLVTALPFAALEMSGRLVDTARGANLAEVLDPHSGQRTSPLGELHLLLGVAVFLLIGGHHAFLRTVAESFAAFPVTAFPEASPASVGAFAEAVAGLGAAALATAVGLAGPAIVAIVASEIALGILNRAAPQMAVYFIGMPLRAAAGLAAATLTVALLLPALRAHAAQALHALSVLLS